MEHIKRVMHGESKTRLYRIWSNLKNRVLPNSVKAKYYFDRGIGLCDEWKNSFISFRDWSINNGYDDKLTIDRIDNNLGYSPENCRWVDMKTQANNRSNNITVYADKTCVPFSDVCRILGVDYNTAYGKIIMNLVANKNVENFGNVEQKPAWSEEEQNRFAKCVLTSCAMSFIDFLDAHKYEGKMCVSNGECEDIENAFHNAMWDRLHRYYCKYIEKQGEQKPVDKIEKPWSEEDELYIRELESLVKQVWATAEHENDKDTIHKMRDLSFFLKMLKPQPKREILEKLEEWLDEYVSSLADVDTASLICSFTNYLDGKLPKSLRPQSQWRPSVEQIDALEHFVRSIGESGYASPYENNTKLLYSLLEQLKKL